MNERNLNLNLTPNHTPRDNEGSSFSGPSSLSGINFTQFQTITQNFYDKSQTHSNSESNNTPRRLVCNFLKQHSSYDVLPVSYRIIVLDTSLLVKKALAALMQNGIYF